MKLVFVIVLVVVLIALFVVGIVSPARSRRMQRGVDRLSQSGEEKSGVKGGWFRTVVGPALRMTRGAADKSAKKGRQIHDNLKS